MSYCRIVIRAIDSAPSITGNKKLSMLQLEWIRSSPVVRRERKLFSEGATLLLAKPRAKEPG